jgi:hypothetical protein
MMNPKPDYSAQAKKRKAERKRSTFELRYGSSEYVAAVTSQRCIIELEAAPDVRTPCVYTRGRSEAAHIEKKTRDPELHPLSTWVGLFAACTQHHGEGEGRDPRFYLETYGVDVRHAARCNVEAHGHLVQ